MLGTGFEGSPREPVASAIEAINAQKDTPVVACDISSGVNATTGEIEGSAVNADATASFHGAKIGLYVAPGKFHSGDVHIVAIGVPRGAPAPTRAGLITQRVIDLVPHRPRDGSKFKSGVVVIAGGSRGLTGAPTMVARAAQRTGAGYVQVAVPESAQQTLELRLLEAMTRGMPERGRDAHGSRAREEVAEMAERAGAVVLGPGIGKGDGPRCVRQHGSRNSSTSRSSSTRTASTPSPAPSSSCRNAARPPSSLRTRASSAGCSRWTPSEIERRRLHHAREAAERSGCVVVLKGDDSIVAQPGGDAPTAISPGATPALATAGTGDVLSGIIGALLAKGLTAFEAASAGVLVHATRASRPRAGSAAPTT